MRPTSETHRPGGLSPALLPDLRILWSALLLCLGAYTVAQTGYSPVSYRAMEQFEVYNEAVADFLGGTVATDAIRDRLEANLRELESNATGAGDYLKGQAYFILAILDEGESRVQEAVRFFELSLEYALRAVESEPFSDGYRLVADAYTHLAKHKGVVYQFANGLKIKNNAEQALKLDPDNAKARFSLALYRLNAPPIAGGDRRKAVRTLQSLENDQTLHIIDRYSVLIWLAIAYKQLDEDQSSRRYLARALEMYPRGPWMDELLRDYGL